MNYWRCQQCGAPLDNHGRCRMCAPACSLRRMVRRLRWLAVGQVAIFLYALTTIGAIVTLGMDSRWECWVLMPIPGLAIPVLFHWGRWFPAESPNDQAHRPDSAKPVLNEGI